MHLDVVARPRYVQKVPRSRIGTWLALVVGTSTWLVRPLAFHCVPAVSTTLAATAISTPGLMPVPTMVPRSWHGKIFKHTQLSAEGETAVAVDPAEYGGEAMPLFQELIVSNRSTTKALRGAVVAIFNKGEKAVDLVLVDSNSKHLLMSTAATVPDQFHASAQLLIRRRDRRLRMRLTQHFQPESDEDPEVFRIGQTINVTKVGTAVQSRLVDVGGNNLKRSVKLEFAGNANAARALLVIESAQRFAYRDLTFIPRYVEQQRQEDNAAEGGSPSTNARQVSFMVTVTAA